MQTKVALITFLDGGYPDNSLPSPQPPSGGRPDNSLPGFPGRPDNSLPSQPGHPWVPGHIPPIGGNLPVYPPVYPGQGLPVYPSQGPVFPTPPVGPDNTLPTPPPGTPVQLPVFPPQIYPVPPGHTQKFELKFSPVYGWVLVPVSDGAGVDNTLPATGEPK